MPPDLIESFSIANGLFDRGPPTQTQAVLSEFINHGYLNSHVRRMRSAYAARREALISSLHTELGGMAEIEALAGGLRVIAHLPAEIDDKAAEEAAARQGVTGFALSNYYKISGGQSGLLLGFACTPEGRMREAARKLADALRPPHQSSSPD